MEKNDKNRRKSKRNKLNTEVQFIFSADVINAHSVDISDEGIRLDLNIPLEIEMRFEMNGKYQEHKAQLCWAERQEDNSFSYGFKFKQ